MRLALNEVLRLAQKAAEGAGAPAGLDTDAGVCAEWLEARGLPGLAALADALEAGQAAPARCRAADIEDARLRFDAASDVLVGTLAVEWAATRSRQVQIAGLSGALGVLPALARLRGELGARTCLVPGADGTLAAAAGEGRALELFGDWARGGLGGTVILAFGAPARGLARTIGESLARRSGNETDAAYRSALDHGIDIDDALYARLGRFAAEILVPESEISRLRGAGAANVDDNN